MERLIDIYWRNTRSALSDFKLNHGPEDVGISVGWHNNELDRRGETAQSASQRPRSSVRAHVTTGQSRRSVSSSRQAGSRPISHRCTARWSPWHWRSVRRGVSVIIVEAGVALTGCGQAERADAAAWNSVGPESQRVRRRSLPGGPPRRLSYLRPAGGALPRVPGPPAAPPGTSEHNLGIALDLATSEMRSMVDSIGPAFGWAKVTAPKKWWHITYAGR